MRSTAVLVTSLLLLSVPAFADDLTTLTQFRTGVYTDGLATANISIGDVTRDGIPDVVSCSQGSAFVLTRSGTALVPAWFSESVGCTAATLGDANGDGALDVIVGTNNNVGYTSAAGSIVIYDPQTFGPARARVQLPGTSAVTDVAYGDVDHDGKPEIVAITSSDAYVYDAATLTLKWTALGKGGTKIAIGDLEGDGTPEIVVNGGTGHVLDAKLQYEKWGYVGGFGRSMAVGDVDQDGRAEVVFLANNATDTLTIIEGDTFVVSTISATQAASYIAIGDANADGVPEIIVGSSSSGPIRGIRRSNSQILYSIANPEYNAAALAVGDVDGDGYPEVVWTASYFLMMGSAATQAVKWKSIDLDSEFGGVVADLDGDGKLELVMKTSVTQAGNLGGVVQIFDLQTRALKMSIAPPSGYSARTLRKIAVGQMDGDAALEIVALGTNSYDPYLYVFDGVTGALEYQSPYTAYFSVPGFAMTALYVGNIDNDSITEIVVATSDNKIEVLNGASSFIQWSSPALDGSIVDMSVADIDHDGTLELVVGTYAGLYVFNATTGEVRSHITLSGITRVAATASGAGYYAVSTSNNGLRLYSNANALLWQCSSTTQLYSMTFTTLGGDVRLATGDYAGDLRFYPVTGNTCPVPLVRNAGRSPIINLASYEINGDSNPELLLSYPYLIELTSFSLSRYARGDFDGDGVVTDADIDALAFYLYGGGPGAPPAADVNSDGAVAGDDLFYLINYKRGTGPAPLP